MSPAVIIAILVVLLVIGIFVWKIPSESKAKKTYKLSSVTKAAKKYISVSKNGKVTVKKGLKKGSYTLMVKITAAATADYGKTTVTKAIRIQVR